GRPTPPPPRSRRRAGAAGRPVGGPPARPRPRRWRTPPPPSAPRRPRSRAAEASADRLDPDSLGEQLAVVCGVAQEELGRLGPLEVQVGVVLPREADATVDLDVLGRG